MNNSDTKTYFAPAGRATEQELQYENNITANSELIATLLNAMPDFLMVLNEHRQIIAVNQRLLTTFGVENPEALLGMRPGEAVGCMHVKDGPDGCGTSLNCAVCGAVLTILASQEAQTPQKGECRLMLSKDTCSALDLDVLATPVSIDNKPFTVLALRDISSDKRRSVMERVFFHDILNNAGGIRGLASLLADGTNPDDEQEYKEWMVLLSDNLIEEINHQRRLLQAEQGIYHPVFEQINLLELLHGVKHLYENHERTEGRIITIEGPSNCLLFSDLPLVRRIVGNMLLNAIEASKAGDTVSILGDCQSGRIRISVDNPGEIPTDVQLQLFKRSFSTKSKEGRGLGTYSMKLFGERYLGGTVGFHSSNGMTSFFIELPLKPPHGD